MAGYIGSKASVINSGVENKKVITATAGQTSFTGLTYSPNRVHVFQNGVRLVDGTDYTATNGTSLTLTVGAAANDQVVVVSYSGFTVGDVVPASTGGTFSNPVTIDADGATVLTIDRATSDGTIIDLQKSGSSVGSIGTANTSFGTNPYIAGSGGRGLSFDVDVNRIFPCSSAGARADGSADLGASTARFKDLFLSGGVYLGGTGSANKLDDYEEGIWTPTLNNVTAPSYTVQTGIYTKIGRMVFVSIIIEYSGLNTGDASSLNVNLPFTASAQGVFHLAESSSNTGFAGTNTISLIGSTGAGSTAFSFGSTGVYNDGDYDSGNWAQSGALRFYGSYPAS